MIGVQKVDPQRESSFRPSFHFFAYELALQAALNTPRYQLPSLPLQPIPDSAAHKFGKSLHHESLGYEVIRMTPTQIAVLIAVVIAVVALVAVFILQQRTKKLRAKFGPEYDRTVAQTGSKFKAEAELEKVEKRVNKYPLRPLTAADRDRFQQSWRVIQAKFVDNPAGAFVEADQLLGAVMSARGYPPSDFENRATEISVDHGTVVEHYRAGHDVAVLQTQGQATTEDLRRGMVHYRALFDELMLDETVPAHARAVGRG